MQASFGIFVSIVVSILVLFDLVSLGLTTALITRTGAPFEIFLAFLGGAVPMVVSFTVLLFVTLPACICSLRRKDEDSENDCCTPTYFVSVVVSSTISVIGAYTAGSTQIFAAFIYEDVKTDASLFSLIQGAAALNFIAGLFGTCLIFITLCACLKKPQNWKYCSDCPSCNRGTLIAFILVDILTIAIVVVSLLTVFMSVNIDAYSGKGDSANNSRGLYAIFFSCGAAGFLLFGLCIGGPILCCMTCLSRKDIIRITGIVMGVWALLTAGTIVSGGLMTKVGQSFASEETLDPDENLNRGPISAQGYFIGALSFAVVLTAILLCCCGIYYFNNKKLQEEDQSSDQSHLVVVAVVDVETTGYIQQYSQT